MMSSSTLIALVGNDVHKADELVTVFAGLVLSFLQAMHKEGESNGSIIEGSDGASESNSNSVHSTVDSDTGTIQQGEHGMPVCATGESIESGVVAGADTGDRRGLGDLGIRPFSAPGIPATSCKGFPWRSWRDFWPGSFTPGTLFGGSIKTSGTLRPIWHNRSG